jgi:hypothetical protein
VSNITDIATVVLRLDGVIEPFDQERGPRKIVVRQDRLMPITYVERHFHDMLEISAQMMPHGQDRIWSAGSFMFREKAEVLGTWMLGILNGQDRYAHIGALRGDGVAKEVLGMNKIIGD